MLYRKSAYKQQTLLYADNWTEQEVRDKNFEAGIEIARTQDILSGELPEGFDRVTFNHQHDPLENQDGNSRRGTS